MLAQLAECEKYVSMLSGHDGPILKEAFKAKSAEAAQLRLQLHNMRLVRAQLSAAIAARERAGKLVNIVRQQLEDLHGLIKVKERELLAAEADFVQQAAAAAALAEQQAVEARRRQPLRWRPGLRNGRRPRRAVQACWPRRRSRS